MASNPMAGFVFIDPRVANLQMLIAGAQPGQLVFVLDANSDGLQQIADILAANGAENLAAIQIVSHGSTGQVQLGSTLLNDGDLAEHSAALAQIGASMAGGGGPLAVGRGAGAGGTLLLYGCDVAAGDTGKQFIADLSQFTGADVAASTDATGAATLGGNW